MKSQLLKIAFAIAFLMLLFVEQSFAVTTWNWTGGAAANPTDWATSGNWTHTGTTPTDTYPGKTASSVNDIVQIGVSTTFSSLPIISSTTTVKFASLTFGSNGATPGNEGFQALTIYGTLTVTGTITQNPGTIGAKNAGGNCGSIAGTINLVSITIMTGTGTVNCNSIQVGNATPPANANVVNYIIFKIASFDPNVSTLTVNVTTDFLVESASSVVGGKISSNNDAICSFSAGTLTVGGTIKLINNGKTLTTTVPCNNYLPFANFSVDLNDTHLTPADNPVLILKGANPVSIPADFNTGDVFDFYNNAGGGGVATINYAGTGATQEVYSYNGSNASFVHFDQDGPVAGDQQGVYDNLVFSGSGNKTVDAGTLSVFGSFTLKNTVNPATPESVLLNAGTTTTITGNYSTATSTVLTGSSGTVTISGTSYDNSGTSNFGTGLVTFNGTAATAYTSSTAGGITNFTNVAFTGGNANSMTSGTYKVASTGVITLTANTTNTTLAAGGFLTLLSDANGSATVANLHACSITGNVNVQRYIIGGSIANRGYRLISSPVNAGAANGNNIYSVNYLPTSTYVSGTNFRNNWTTGGTSKMGNPSIYLYRDDISPLYTSFLNSDFRAINSLTSSPNYPIDIDSGPSLTTLFNIPVGSGYLFYFRGGLTTTTPFTAGVAAQPATLTATGALNQGPIKAANWFNPAAHTLDYSTVTTDNTIRGANLVGNPYPAAIDWNTYSATNTAAGIYAPNVGPFVYELLPGSAAGAGNYAVYSNAAITHTAPVNGGTNIIASGQGFFVYVLPLPGQPALPNSSTLTFNEAAKINTSPGPATFLAKLPASAKAVTAQLQYIRLKAALDSINSDETVISFYSGASAAFNPMEDARYKAGSGKISLGSLTSDNIGVAINSTPFVPKGQTIPLKINASASGTYTLSADQINGIPQLYDVWLKDAYTNDSVDMRKTPVYSFTINLADTTTFGSKRFTVVISQDPALAYKLTSFNASQVPNKEQVQLTWKTANEQNYTQFAVERSTDLGKTFDTLNSQTSDGSGAYCFLDQEPGSDNLYRLRQQDVNGNVTRSNVLEVLITDRPQDAVSINVYPNPVVSNLTLTIKPRVVETNVTYRIKVSNSSGLVVKQVITQNTSWQDNISNLQLGTYLVQVLNNSDNSVVGETKFIKL